MNDRIYLSRDKRSLKGNVHTHSTRSDGEYSPREVFRAYRNKGYDFICLSDHEIYYKSDEFDSEDFIALAGYEMACDMSRSATGQQYHIHGLLDKELGSDNEFGHDEEHEKPHYEQLATIQALIDEMIERGNWIIMNHPEWSKNRAEDLIALQSYNAIEIYNHQSELDEAVGYSVHYWDDVLRSGRKVLAVAADDAHRGDYTAAYTEFFGGWVQVEADALEQTSIISAMKAGRYYSSSGPKIHDLRVENGTLKIECSDVSIIRFITFPCNGKAVFNLDASPVRQGEYKIRGDEMYIRVECVDYAGKTAWSNPVYVDELL